MEITQATQRLSSADYGLAKLTPIARMIMGLDSFNKRPGLVIRLERFGAIRSLETDESRGMSGAK